MTLQRKHLYWVGAISATIALLAVWTFAIEWEWSFIGDDASWVQRVRNSVAAGNSLSPILQAPGWSWSEATSWGLFRPTSIVYYSLVYQLPVEFAHFIRLAMFLTALATPLILVYRNNGSGFRAWPMVWVLGLGFANYSMAYGAYFVSLSELTAIFLVAIGLLVPNKYAKVLFFLLAALAKAPFIWLVLIYAIYLIWQKTYKTTGIIALLICLSSLIIIIYASQVGSYTSSLTFNPWHFLKNLEQLGTYGVSFLIVLLVGIFVFLSNLKPTPLSYVLLLGAILFTGNLLAWNTIGYYNAPIWFLITCAMATAFKPTLSDTFHPNLVSRGALTLCLAGSVLISVETFRVDVFGRNTMVIEAREWVATEADQNTKIALSYIDSREFDFYLSESHAPLRRMVENLPSDWPMGGEDFDFVISITDGGIPSSAIACPPIKVWTRGFLSPLAC